jgi:alkylation response protein AidB-like acyl-CoA dehydrogenase
MVGPTIITHGTPDQKQEHLSRILSGEVQWCQGFSEPGSGSDLASLQTRAVKDGDDYVINGQKIWTSGAQYAHWMFMMARTDPEAPKHKGISYFLVDMKAPGVEVRPLTNLANQDMFSEVFFQDVRVPAKNIVGELNRGWYVGTTTLDFERSSIGSAVGIRLQLDELVKYARENEAAGISRTGYMSSLKTELADRYIEANVARMMSYRVVTMQAKGLIPNHEASMTKLFASELGQRIARTGVKVLGLYGQLYGENAPMRGRYESSYMTSLSSTIAGGTSEIQRNIIATRGLGLPRD